MKTVTHARYLKGIQGDGYFFRGTSKAPWYLACTILVNHDASRKAGKANSELTRIQIYQLTDPIA